MVSLHVTRYIKKFHTYRFTQAIVFAAFLVTIAFALTDSPFWLAVFFVAHFTLTVLMYVSINTIVESFTPHDETGMTRGIFLTLLNLGILVSPFFGGAILARSGYASLYIVAAFILVPLMILLHSYMRHVPDPHYTKIELVEAFRRGWADKNIKAVLIATFLLESFYAVMVIYSPLYLGGLGIPLTVYLTAILPVALLPLVVFPYELGILADTKLGEKELMIAGLLIMSGMSMIAAVTTSSSFIVWIIILTLGRVGAACVETMVFSYYFKKVNAADISLISLFSNMRTLATIAVPLIGAFVSPLFVIYPALMFVLISIMLLYGAFKVLPLHDTR
jgi:MFS family permease